MTNYRNGNLEKGFVFVKMQNIKGVAQINVTSDQKKKKRIDRKNYTRIEFLFVTKNPRK